MLYNYLNYHLYYGMLLSTLITYHNKMEWLSLKLSVKFNESTNPSINIQFRDPFDFRAFYDLMKNLSEFSNLLQDEFSSITVFAPSSDFLSSLSSGDLQRISANPQALRTVSINIVFRFTKQQ